MATGGEEEGYGLSGRVATTTSSIWTSGGKDAKEPWGVVQRAGRLHIEEVKFTDEHLPG